VVAVIDVQVVIRHLGQALMRGEYVKLTAEIFRAGQPADPWAASWLGRRAIRQALRLRAVSDTSLTHDLYDGTKLTQKRLQEFIARYRIKGWRVTRSGRLSTANRDFIGLAEDHRFRDADGRSRFADLPDVDKILDQLHELQLIAGSDNRYRTPIWAFSTITGRMAPNGAAYPFATASWTRPTMMPAAGMALAYLDFASMEFGVAGGLSQCRNMLADYNTEPYLVLPILAKLLPSNATKETHRAEREAYKAPTLSLQYGGGASLMVHKLGLTKSQGQRLVDLHHERFAGYWAWSDRKVQRAFDDGELVALDGWRCGVTSLTTEFTARNWLIQANAQAIFRYAGLMMRALGLRLVAIVHDAVLIEAPVDRIDREVARATVCLERASRRFLRGLNLRVDPKIIRDGERFTDGRGAKVWAFVERTLREIEEGRVDVA
jgi:DNA polymerase I